MKEVKIRINKVEREVLKALEVSAKEYPELTTAEIGSALLRILQDLNNQDLNPTK